MFIPNLFMFGRSAFFCLLIAETIVKHARRQSAGSCRMVSRYGSACCHGGEGDGDDAEWGKGGRSVVSSTTLLSVSSPLSAECAD